MRILAVDDEPDILVALELSWLTESIELVTAKSGREALECLDPAPDVVLTDYKMPGMNGLELAAQLHHSLPGVPVVLMTAFPDPTLGAGLADQIKKPFDAADVLQRLRDAVA